MFTLPCPSMTKPVFGCHLNVVALFLAVAMVTAIPLSAQETDTSSAVKIDRIEDVIDNWSPEQHLFVKGEVGASPAQLAKLEQWLDTHGPHWTVVLMNNARDEYYVAPDGEKFRGMDAVEFSLAHRLANQTEFGELVHAKTGETSGAVFVLYLAEREFAYYSTDVYDRRGLGQSRWVGNLDREVIRAMRSGDRIIDAVRNTVSLIESRLEKQVDKEISDALRAQERVRIERTRDIDNLKSLVHETETSMLSRVEESAREIRTKYPDALQSDLAQPPLEPWRAALMSLRKEAENPEFLTADLMRSQEFRDAKLGIQKIRVEINRFLDSYAVHRAFEDMVHPLEARLDAIADHPSGIASQASAEAYRLLDESRGGHDRGELGFAANIEQVLALIEQGEQAIAVEQIRIKQDADRKQLIRRTLVIVAMCLGVVLFLILWVLNMRRRSALRRAHALFEKRSKAVENEVAKIDELIAESETVIGSPESFAERNFQGQTLLLGNAAQHRIGNLKDMSVEALREIGSCYELLHPSNPIAEATNMFTTARYEHCINQLNGQTLQVPGRVDDRGVASEPIWMSFDEFVSDAHERKKVLSLNLKSLGDSLKHVKERVGELQARINLATEQEKKLSRAARLDRCFKIPALFEAILPSVQADCDRAAALAESDPIQAISDHVTLGLRKITDALDVANTIEKARTVLLPQLEESGKQLQHLGFDHRWIAERVETLGVRSNEVLANAIERGVSQDASQLDADLTGLGQRVRRSCELAVEILNVVEPNLVSLQQRISEARRTIATKLGIDPTNVLHEDQYDPEVEFAQAQKQLQSARAAIDYGGVESVMESLEVLKIESNEAERLIESSLTSLTEFETSFAARDQTHLQLASQLPTYQSTIASIKQRFAESSLRLREQEFVGGSWDRVQPDDDSPTVERVMTTCAELLENSKKTITSIYTDHFAGKVLEAANSLELVRDDLECVREMFQEIDRHGERVSRLAVENATHLRKRILEVEALVRDVEDDRAQQLTVQQSSDLAFALREFGIEFEKGGNLRDPFDDSIRLSNFEMQIDELTAALDADRSAFQEASRAVGGAQAELATASQLVARSVSDRIPDSRTISQCQDEVTRAEVELVAIRKRLNVAHENWKMVNDDANQLGSKLGVINGRMRQELDLAQQAIQRIGEAADAVYEAASWRGSYRVAIVGNPGSSELEEARKQLNEGNYSGSIEFCKAARFSARNAIDRAVRQVEQHRRKLAREAAEARRRRESAATSFMIGNSLSNLGSSGRSSRSGLGTGFGSSSGSGSSSSSSSSSSSGRSSGFSRSSW